MSSPTVLVLCFALVCSSVDVISEQIFFNSIRHNSMQNIKKSMQGLVEDHVNDKNMRMNTGTNVSNMLNNVPNLKYETNSYKTSEVVDDVSKYDEIYTENETIVDVNTDNTNKLKNRSSSIEKKRVKREEKLDKCDSFTYEKGKVFLTHPHIGDNDNVNYSSSTYCTTVIRGLPGNVVQLTFIDMFHIEEHPDCSYDYLEVRDGDKGYYNLLGKVCGEEFPPQITTTGPNAWLKFHSDDTIEYKGFRIQIDFIPKDTSYSVPESCVTKLSGKFGRFDSNHTNEDCLERTEHTDLDYLWSIDVPAGHKIYLNLTKYLVGEPNECDKNFVQVYGSVLEYDANLAIFCGSAARPVATTGPEAGKTKEFEDEGNIMHVRLFAAKEVKATTYIDATFNAYRTLDLTKNNTCDPDTEFDCQDSTCIDISLRCDGFANCRLKADEEKDLCKHTTESLIQQPQIRIIVSIFGVIMSGIIFVFLFKCISKLYNDHKIIKEQMSKACEDQMDSMYGSQLLLDAKRMQSDVGPRASLERDNQTNEMFKQQRKLQQKARPISIDSDFIPELHQDLEEELWHGKVNDLSKTEDDITDRYGKMRRKVEREIEDIKIERARQKEDKEIEDIRTERKERKRLKKQEQENLRQKEELIRRKESEERNQISEAREVSIDVPDTKQSACQTRESLFDTEPIVSSSGSGPANRGSSKFGYSGASVSRPSPPQIKPSEIVIEVIRPNIEHERKTQKKILADRRPMSAETTRSAPDVIILAKPEALRGYIPRPQ